MHARAIAWGGLRFAGERDKCIGYASVCHVKTIEAIKGVLHHRDLPPNLPSYKVGITSLRCGEEPEEEASIVRFETSSKGRFYNG